MATASLASLRLRTEDPTPPAPITASLAAVVLSLGTGTTSTASLADAWLSLGPAGNPATASLASVNITITGDNQYLFMRRAGIWVPVTLWRYNLGLWTKIV